METDKFITYVYSFYGSNGLYPKFLPGLTLHELAENYHDWRASVDNYCGDSWDRERYRDYLISKREDKKMDKNYWLSEFKATIYAAAKARLDGNITLAMGLDESVESYYAIALKVGWTEDELFSLESDTRIGVTQ